MIQVTNQKPVELPHNMTVPVTGGFDPIKTIKENIVNPMMTPLITGHDVKITDNGKSLSEDDIADSILNCLDDTLTGDEDKVKEIFGSTLLNYNKANPLLVKDAFAVQSADKVNLPYPSPMMIYTPASDIIPACKGFLAGTSSYDELFASFAFYSRTDSLGVYFANEIEFDQFKQFFASQISNIAAGLSADCNTLCQEFDKLELKGLTESLILRNDVSDNQNDYDFARLLYAYLMEYIRNNNNGLCDIMPFSLSDYICPRTIIFINLEMHAHATPQKIKAEWTLIETAMNMKVQMVSNNHLNKLTAVPRAIAKAQAAAVMASKKQQSAMNAMKAARFMFTPTAPNYQDLVNRIARIIRKMANVTKSQNPEKTQKKTFAKPNRRDPDDWNKKGKARKTNFKPDIHVYVDTSGSISEENYRDAIRACIAIAKKCNVNLYFNSFSDVMSQTTLLHTKDKTPGQIFKEFEKVPKVTGCTDFEQIWHFINQSPKRTKEFSLIVTDFEWSAGNYYVKHPRNLFYMPCAQLDWQTVTYWTEKFCKSMVHNDPGIRKHILF